MPFFSSRQVARGRACASGTLVTLRACGRLGTYVLSEPIIASSASAVRPSEKSSINTNRKSPTRFPMSLRWSSYTLPLSPPKGGSKTQNSRFPSTIALRLKKVCYKVSLCENCQRQSCRVFIGLTIHAKIIGGDVPFYLKFWVRVTALERNRRFSLVAPNIYLSVKTVSDRVVRHSLG